LGVGDLAIAGASAVETLVAVKNALAGAPVYVHLDLDVLDPRTFPAQFPAQGGLAPDKLYDLLEAVAEDSELVGLDWQIARELRVGDTVHSRSRIVSKRPMRDGGLVVDERTVVDQRGEIVQQGKFTFLVAKRKGKEVPA